jgi:hypothetical protein
MTMKNQELFVKNPLSWKLVNEGVSSNNSADLNTLRYELETFVCEGEYHSGLAKILDGYLGNFGKEQKAAWVSGFYGSGKSHLVKVLRYLWNDFKFPDGTTARTIATLPPDITEKLTELSTRGKQAGGLHSAGGTLKAGIGSVRLRVLGIIFQSTGLTEKISTAKLLMDLRDEGVKDAVESTIREAGKDPIIELDRFYTSRTFHEAYLKAFPHQKDLKTVSDVLRAQYPAKTEEISIDDLVSLIRRALTVKKQLPCTVIVLDEVQQFISGNADTALEVQEVVEACCKMLDGRVLFVGTGQSALNDMPALQRLLGRFTTKVHLRDNDVEKVVRTVVLQKKDIHKKEIAELCSRQAGEITRQLKDTKIATRGDDDKAYVADYPLLPVRKRFWEQVLHRVDTTGTVAQMRTQLRVTHEACRAVADKPIGTVIPADFLYGQLVNELVNTGEMQKRFQEIIEEQKTKDEGELRSRICSLVFLINKLHSEDADIGLRANAEHLGDLLTDDIGQSATILRQKVPETIKQLLSDGILMEVDGEYRLQTTEGAAWESEFRRKRASILNNDPQIASMRSRLLIKGIEDQLSKTAILHGESREKRKVLTHHGMEQPPASDDLVVWVRDGYQESENMVLQDIQRRSIEDATIHVLIPKLRTDDLKNALASSLAAEETLHFKGNPSSTEGKEARAAMQTRKTIEENKTNDLIGEVIRGARVFLSGGQELPVLTLEATVQHAAEQVLDRLFPKFRIADSSNWPTVWKKAKDGNAGALQIVGHNGDPDKHPVAKEIIQFIGAGKKGSEIIAQFTKEGYGWPKDAIDATILTLIVSGHLGARLQGKPIQLSDIDQRKISQVEFRVEHPVLTAQQKIRIRKLYQDAGIQFQPGDEIGGAQQYLQAMKTLAVSAGGEPPAPIAPQDPLLIDLAGKMGNDLLFELFEKADELTKKNALWKDISKEIKLRIPQFEIARRLIAHAAGLPDTARLESALDSISNSRSLLDSPDPVAPVLKAVGTKLRAELHSAALGYKTVYDAELKKLEANSTWSKLAKQKKETIFCECDISGRTEPDVGTDKQLEVELNTCSLSHWRTLTDALSTRFEQALEMAIIENEPKAVRVDLPSATIRNKIEMEEWLTQARESIEESLKKGPVIL